MSDMTEGWKSFNETKRQKKYQNQEQSTRILEKESIPFESKNYGTHLVIQTKPVIDFWPSTGLWIVRGKDIKKRGVRGLLRYLKDNQMVGG